MLIKTGRNVIVKIGKYWRLGQEYKFKDLTLIFHRDFDLDTEYILYQWTETIMFSKLVVLKVGEVHSGFFTVERAVFLMSEYLERSYDYIIDSLRFWSKVEPYILPIGEVAEVYDDD